MASSDSPAEQKLLSPIPMPQQLTTRKLNGTNYIQWSKAIKVAVTGYGKQKHLTESAPPETDSKHDAWIQEDAHLVSLLWNSMEPNIADMCTHLDTCKDIWEYVRLLFSSDLTRMYDLSREFFQLQQSGRPVTEYFASLKRVHEELNSLQPLSTDVNVMQKQREQMVVLRFLAGLDPEFEPVKAQILSGASLPSFAETYSRVMRAASRDQSNTVDATRTALTTQITTESKNSSHMISSQNWDQGTRGGRGRGRGRGGRGVRPKCSNCGRIGHAKETCWNLHGKPAHMVHTVSSDPSTDKPSTSESPTVTLSGEEYARFLQFQTAHQASLPIASLAHQGNSTTRVPWVIDSGASDHMSSSSSLFSNIECSTIPSVTTANGSSNPVKGIGKVYTSLPLSSVLYVPSLSFNLLSVSKLTKQLNCSMTFFPNSVVIQDLKTRKKIGEGHEAQGLYYLADSSSPPSTSCSAVAAPIEVHCRLGHPSFDKLKSMVPSLSQVQSLNCESCQLGKHHRASFSPRVNNRSSSLFDLVHSDVWGPSRVVSKLGFKYFVTFIDDFSRLTWIYLMKDRSELLSIFQSFCAEIKTQFGVTIKVLRSDNAKEYFSKPFTDFMSSFGMIHQSSCSRTPQQNGVVERKNLHLIETARCLMFHMKVPKVF